MAERLAEYLAVLGTGTVPAVQKKPPAERGASHVAVEVQGCLLQRFPAANREDCPLPVGIERFCRPLGWFIVDCPSSPNFTNFILTGATAQALYCTALNFHQPNDKLAMSRRLVEEEEDGMNLSSLHASLERAYSANRSHETSSSTPFKERRRTAFKRRSETEAMSISVSSIEVNLDEEKELSFSMGSLMMEEELYEPRSLCLVSKFPLFDALQSLLKAVFISWAEGHKSLEKLIAELLVELRFPIINKPPLHSSFGPLKELIIPPLSVVSSLPYTSTDAVSLLRAVGVNNLLQLIAAAISDVKLLFISSSFTNLTSAMMGLVSLLYPVGIDHYSRVLIPSGLSECVQLPTPFIMGLHRSLLEELDEQPVDVVMVDIDYGELRIPELAHILSFPGDLVQPIKAALSKIMNPGWECRDYAFPPSVSSCADVYYQDRAIRAVFLNMFLYLLGDYQLHITVLRFHPEPKFHFNQVSYMKRFLVGEDKESWRLFIKALFETIGFDSFVRHTRVAPYRLCDYFDELVKRRANNPDLASLDQYFSSQQISLLAEELLELLPPSVRHGGSYSCSASLLNELSGDLPGSSSRCSSPSSSPPSFLSSTQFPTIDQESVENIIEDLDLRWKGAASTPLTEAMSNVPLLEAPSLNRTTLESVSNVVHREVDSLAACLDAIFEGKILEARKYITVVILSLKQGSTTGIFVSELVERLLKYGALLSSEQFELLVRLVNSAIINEKMAMTILPLAAVFHQEVQPNVQQYLYTCIQGHAYWNQLEFWKQALFGAVQAELVRISAELLASQQKRKSVTSLKQRSVEGSLGFNIAEEDEETEEVVEEAEKDDINIGTVTMLSRQRLRSYSPTRIRELARNVSKTMRKKVRSSTVNIPGPSEGVLPPDARPVTAYEALHHLAKRLKVWLLLDDEDKKLELKLQEENGLKNQLVLFVDRIINLHTPVDLGKGGEERTVFKDRLIEFIEKFLSVVEVDLDLKRKDVSFIHMFETTIDLHIETMYALQQAMKKIPLARARVAKPPLISDGEEMLIDGIHCYLLPDGRDSGRLVPADGQVFLSSYRVIFLGSPCDPTVDPNLLVTRSVPIASIYRLKVISQVPIPSLTLQAVRGLQIRSSTAELIRLGFDDETSSAEFDQFTKRVTSLRYPPELTIGIKLPFTPLSPLPLPVCNARARRRSSEDTGIDVGHTQMKLKSDMSKSPYCCEYNRLGLGSLIFESKNRGPWRLSTLNIPFTVCSSYPAVWVVPEKSSDSSLIRIAQHFQDNRLPVVTWKHPRTHAVLLRSSSFLTSPAPKKKPILSKPTDKAPDQDLVGIMNPDVEAFLSEIVRMSPNNGALDTVGKSLTLSFTRDTAYPLSSFRMSPDLSECPDEEEEDELRRADEESTESPELSETRSQYKHSLYASSEHSFELFSGGFTHSLSFEEQPMTLASNTVNDRESMFAMYSLTERVEEGDDEEEEGEEIHIGQQSPNAPDLGIGVPDISEVFGKNLGPLDSRGQPHTSIATLPTNPRDWIMTDILPNKLDEWQTNGLYVLGDKNVLRNVAGNVYSDCTLVPVELPHYSQVWTSFQKLMRACAPSLPHSSSSSKYRLLVEDSDWLNQLSNILQLAGAVADLLDLQGSSVLVAMENGSDATIQVVALAQILLDPHYRTLEGFKALIEKDWLAFGHPFTQRSQQQQQQSNSQDQQSMSAVFLQFLDCVHQIQRQFPLSFEFNDFYLRTLAYHITSLRFHTFTLSCEKERCALNWLPYRPRPASIHGDLPHSEQHSSIWTYIEGLHNKSTMFQNFLYETPNDPEMLTPLSFQANLDVWSFHLDNPISHFPPYDTELISEGQLTLSDLDHFHHYVSLREKSPDSDRVPLDPPPEVTSEISLLVKQYTVLLNTKAAERNLEMATWKQWYDYVSSEASELLGSIPESDQWRQKAVESAREHDRTLHWNTSLAVLIKGKLAVEMEQNYTNPHHFITVKLPPSRRVYECCFCHHLIKETSVYQCKRCNKMCHDHCKARMPHNCRVSKSLENIAPLGDEDVDKNVPRSRSGTLFRSGRKKEKKEDLHECEGFLFKKGGIVKNWKLRYFVLDANKKYLAYYDKEKMRHKLCGKIPLETIVSVEECETQPVPASVLKEGQAGFFFRLTTNRRVFHLMSLRSSSRSVWLQKITSSMAALQQ